MECFTGSLAAWTRFKKWRERLGRLAVVHDACVHHREFVQSLFLAIPLQRRQAVCFVSSSNFFFFFFFERFRKHGLHRSAPWAQVAEKRGKTPTRLNTERERADHCHHHDCVIFEHIQKLWLSFLKCGLTDEFLYTVEGLYFKRQTQ